MFEKLTRTISGLDRTRDLYVYAPDDYQTSGKRYPVLYFHDAQNLFDDETAFGGVSWGIHRQFNVKGKPEAIIVAIDNDDKMRLSEYSPFRADERALKLLIANQNETTETKSEPVAFGGEGQLYIKWLATELKPEIDTLYPTLTAKEQTSIVGSSMGGLISLYAGIAYPTTFGNMGVLSPAFWFCEAEMRAYLIAHLLQKEQKVYMTVGTDEGAGIATSEIYEKDAKKMADVLATQDVQSYFEVIQGGTHNEKDWEPILNPMFAFFTKPTK